MRIGGNVGLIHAYLFPFVAAIVPRIWLDLRRGSVGKMGGLTIGTEFSTPSSNARLTRYVAEHDGQDVRSVEWPLCRCKHLTDHI